MKTTLIVYSARVSLNSDLFFRGATCFRRSVSIRAFAVSGLENILTQLCNLRFPEAHFDISRKLLQSDQL